MMRYALTGVKTCSIAHTSPFTTFAKPLQASATSRYTRNKPSKHIMAAQGVDSHMNAGRELQSHALTSVAGADAQEEINHTVPRAERIATLIGTEDEVHPGRLSRAFAQGIIMLVDRGYTPLASSVARWMVKMPAFHPLLRNTVVQVVRQGRPHVTGAVSWTGLRGNQPEPMQRLAALLLTDPHTLKTAALVAGATADVSPGGDAATAHKLAPAVVEAVREGHVSNVVWLSDQLVAAECVELVVDLVVDLIDRDEAGVVGAIAWEAILQQRQHLLNSLNIALIQRNMVEAAATAACATVDRGTGSREVAEALAPAMVLAVDAGMSDTVAEIGHLVVKKGYAELMLQLTLQLIDLGRADVVGLLSWQLVRLGRGSTLSQLTYLLVMGGRIREATAANLEAFSLPNIRPDWLASSLASGVSAAVADGAGAQAAAINNQLIEAGRIDICRHIVLAQFQQGRDGEVGAISWAAVSGGLPQVVVQLGAHLTTQGHIEAAMRANVALAKIAGSDAKVAPTAAQSIILACQQGGVDQCAQLTAMLIQNRHENLTGTVNVAVAKQRRADLLGAVAWSMIEHGHQAGLSHLASWLLVNQHPAISAEVTMWLLLSSKNNEEAVAGPMAAAVAAAVDAGVVGTVVQASDAMVQRDLGSLLRQINKKLAQDGRTDVASKITQTAVRLGKLNLLATLGGQLLANGDIGTLAQVAAETVRENTL